MNSTDKYLIVLNPNSGKKQGEKEWLKISALLKMQKIDYDIFFTKYSKHAIKIVRDKINQLGYKKIIAIGGDGTINEVVNGIFLQNKFNTSDITLGVITIGTGNDWGKMFNLPKDNDSLVNIICSGNTFVQDVGKVHYYIGNKKSSRYFINAAGLGFDAIVAAKTNKQKEKGSSNAFSYFKSLISSLYKYKPIPVNISTQKRELHNGNLFTLSVAIGKYTGGGMQQTPNAISDDGLFDLMLIENITKTKIIRKVSKLFNGKINDISEVRSLQTDQLHIESNSKLLLEVDGENIGHAPFEFELIPKSLQIFVP